MARQRRFRLPGQPQHVIQRGNNRTTIFVDERDFMVYRRALIEACTRFGCAVHAYVFMTNHVHLLITPESATAISQVMQSVGRKYVQYFNFRHRRTGTLWEGRHKSTLIDTDNYLLTCYRYIELNPVRAGMVRHPAEYLWSSYRHNGAGMADDLVTEHELYAALDSSSERRRVAYQAIFDGQIAPADLDAIREATNKGWVLGGDRFRRCVEHMVGRQTGPKPRGGDHKSERYLRSRKINRVRPH